jgi:NhaP-type Na+/H+ or K+/H+ antiporter
VTTNQVLLGVGLILVLAVGSQVLASRLRMPAIIVLLPAGFIAGALTTDVNPQLLLGAAFQPLVSLSVAVILYDAGLGLDLRKLRGHTRRVVTRLITLGVTVTWAFGAVFAALLLGMSSGAALMTGAILVVSGPTVVGPLLRFVRPTERLQRVLAWEGSLIDPVGGILGAVVFSAVLAGPIRGWPIRWASSWSLSGSAWPGRSSASHCCGCCCANSGSVRCSARPPSLPAWSPLRPDATSPARTLGCWPRS